MLDLAGGIGADVMITAPSYIQRGWDEAKLLGEHEGRPSRISMW